MNRQALVAALDGLLQPQLFKDYGPNGLQVEGRASIQKLLTGVTASLALIEAAVAEGADAILVHHGLFWRGHDGRVTAWLKQRLALLLAHDINLLAYHLPLDAHPELGNNAQLGRVLGLVGEAGFGDQNLGWMGQAASGQTFAHAQALAAHIEGSLGRSVLAVEGDGRPIRRIAWCTGGAQSYFEAAIASGADAFITGEISEPQAHYARESGVAFLACGHHASERYGVQAVGQHLAQMHGLSHVHVDIDNPA
jgi:dinuclear metal center YbgI/SA1388 family protein